MSGAHFLSFLPPSPIQNTLDYWSAGKGISVSTGIQIRHRALRFKWFSGGAWMAKTKLPVWYFSLDSGDTALSLVTVLLQLLAAVMEEH